MLAAIHAAAPRNARVFSFTLGMVGKNKKGRESTPALVSSRDNYFFISSFFISPFFISPFLDFLAAFFSPFLSLFFLSPFFSSFFPSPPPSPPPQPPPLTTPTPPAT